MTSSPISSIDIVTLTGTCIEHGAWQRRTATILADKFRGHCPECEKRDRAHTKTELEPISIAVIELTGTCDTHGAWERIAPKVIASKLEGRCPECEKDAQAAKDEEERVRLLRQAKTKKQRHIERLIGDAEIPRRFQQRSFDNYRAESDEQTAALQKAKAFADKFPRAMELGASFVFCGPPGTGKTHLACAIGNHVIRTYGNSALFITVFDLIQRVKATYGDKDKSEREVMQGFTMPDLLILDEVGVQFGTDYEKVIITDLINRRYAEMRPTIILSNLDQGELEAYLGARVIDRMFEGGGGVLAFNWDSYRARVIRDKDLPSGVYRQVDAMQG